MFSSFKKWVIVSHVPPRYILYLCNILKKKICWEFCQLNSLKLNPREVENSPSATFCGPHVEVRKFLGNFQNIMLALIIIELEQFLLCILAKKHC